MTTRPTVDKLNGAVLIEFRELRRRCGYRVDELAAALDMAQDALAEGVQYYPSARLIAPDGMVFTIAIEPSYVATGDTRGRIILWDRAGSTWLTHVDAEVFDHDVIAALERTMVLWRQGLVACADCGTIIEGAQSHHYYAGRYCDECWDGRRGRYAGEGGWSAIAARESYD